MPRRIIQPPPYASPEAGGASKVQLPIIENQPRYTLITVPTTIAVGPWVHRFNIPGDELIVTPIDNVPQICATQTPDEQVLTVVGDLTLPNPPGGVVAPDGLTVSFAGPGNFLSITPGVVTAPGTYTVLVTQAVTGVPSGLPSQLTFVLGPAAWPGGGPGAVVIPYPAITGTLFPALAGDLSINYANPVTGSATIEYPATGISYNIDPCPNYRGLWGILYFDDAIQQRLSPWIIAPGVPGGITARGALGISTAHPVKARQAFKSFVLARAIGQGYNVGLTILVRSVGMPNVGDGIPT